MALRLGLGHRGGTPTPPDPRGGAPVPVSGTIGRYRLVERIGVGGFGAVFKAVDPDTDRPVAVKTCTLGEDGHARFFRRRGSPAACAIRTSRPSTSPACTRTRPSWCRSSWAAGTSPR